MYITNKDNKDRKITPLEGAKEVVGCQNVIDFYKEIESKKDI